MASDAHILTNRHNAQVMVSSFLRRQESRVFGGPGFRIKCGMTARKVPTKTCTFMQNKANFRKDQMNVYSYMTKDYRKNDAFAVQKNKANQSQFSRQKTEVRSQKAEYNPGASVVGTRHSVRGRQEKNRSGRPLFNTMLPLYRPGNDQYYIRHMPM